MAYRPENPAGSTSPKDLMANAENFDLLALGGNTTYPDRKGVHRKSWKGMEAEHDAAQANRESQFIKFLDGTGYEAPAPYVPGLIIERPTQTVTYNGNVYRAKSEYLPLKTTNWSIDETRLMLVGDASLRQDMANAVDPEKGAAMLGSQKNLDAEPNTLAARLNDAFPNGFGLNAEQSVHIIAGIDSLTAGAGASSYVDHLAEMLRAGFGDAGAGFLHISGDNNNDKYYWASATAGEVFRLPVDDIRRRMSFDLSGFTYEQMDGSQQAAWGPNRDWDSMRVFYLKQPGGGKFRVDHSNFNSNTYRYEVDTASSNHELAYFDITKKPGGNSNLLFLPGSTAAPGAYGKVCVYGALVKRDINSPSVIITRHARGGHTVAQFADTLDATTQSAWFALLSPTLYLMNGGTNDAGQRPPISPDTLKAKFSAIFSRLPNTCKKVMIAPNMHTGDELNVMPSYRQAIREFAATNGYGYINIAELIGTRARANALGLMLDNTHPNDSCNKIIARRIAEYIGVRSTIIESPKTPFVITSEGGGPAVVQRLVQLSQKELDNLPANVDHVIYDLGLIGGYPIAVAEIDLDAVRQGSLSALGRKAYVRMRGALTGTHNQANNGKASVVEKYNAVESPSPIELTITIGSAYNRIQVVVRSTVAFSLVATGKVVIPLNGFTGRAVYEN